MNKYVLVILCLPLILLSCRNTDEAEAVRLYAYGKELGRSDKPDSAFIVYREALKCLSGSGNKQLQSSIYNDVGDLFVAMNAYELGLDSYRKALSLSKDLADKTNMSHACRGIGKHYFLHENSDSAALYFHRALLLADSIRDREELSSLYNNLSSFSKSKGDYEDAFAYNRLSVDNTKDSVKILRNYTVRGQLYAIKEQYDSALHYLLAALRCPDFTVQVSAYMKLSQLPREAGISDSLRTYWLERAYFLADSIEREADSHEIDRKEQHRQMEQVAIKGRTARNVWSIVTGIVVLVAATVGFFVYRGRLIRKSESLISANRQSQEKRMQENADRERQLVEIVRKTGESCVVRFKETSTYVRMTERLKSGGSFSYEEQEQLQRRVLDAFDAYVRQLSNIVPLSSNDAFLCALFRLGLSTKECAACRGISSETIRSQRTRIKKKIPSEFGEQGLADVIFGQPCNGV